jgi:hypothetical protein
MGMEDSKNTVLSKKGTVLGNGGKEGCRPMGVGLQPAIAEVPQEK